MSGKSKEERADKIDLEKNAAPDVLSQEEVDEILAGRKHKKEITKKESKSNMPVIVTIVLIILIALIGIYIYFSNNPKTIFLKAVDVIFNTAENNIKNPHFDVSTHNLTMDFKIEGLKQSDKAINNLNLEMSYDTDYNKKLINADFRTIYNGSKLINGKLYMEDSNAYLYSDDVLNKYIKITDNDKINVNIEDTKIMISAFNKALMRSIDNEKYLGSKIKIKLGDEEIDTYRSSLILNKDNTSDILEKLEENLKNDTKFIKAYAKTLNTSNAKAKSKVKEIIDDLKEDTQNMNPTTINLYTKGARQEFVKLEIQVAKDNYIDIISLTKLDEENYNFNIDQNSKKTSVSGSIETKVSGNTIKATIKAKLKENNNTTNVTINIKDVAKKTNEVKKENIENNVELDELTDFDQSYMVIKLLSNPNLVKLLTTIS